MAGPQDLEGFGAWYDDKQGDDGDNWHRTLIDPGLFTRLGAIPPGTRVLDVGCGNGYLARRLARAGALVVGVDASRELLERARAREARERLGIVYHERDASRLSGLEAESFDVAVANMSIIDIEDAAGCLGEVARVVRDHGRLVLSISHPCFDVDTRSTYLVEPEGASGRSTIYRKVTGYRSPHSDRYGWDLPDGRHVLTVGYHRPLSWYAHELRRAGWVVVDLEEPSPGPGFESRRIRKEWIEEVPLHLVVEARREPRAR